VVQERQLKVTFRRVRRESAAGERVLAVFCPRRTEAVDLRDCHACEHCRGLCVDPTDRDTFLRCVWSPDDADVPAAPRGAPSARPHETLLASVMTTPARCIAPELSIAELVKVFLEEGISAAPVVDRHGRAVGIVSKTDVLRFCAEEGSEPHPELATDADRSLDVGVDIRIDINRTRDGEIAVRDIMTHVVFTLHAEASVSRAAALMAFEGVHRLVVVDADGCAVGIVSSLDILRWMARQDGYVVPNPRRPTSNRPKDSP